MVPAPNPGLCHSLRRRSQPPSGGHSPRRRSQPPSEVTASVGGHSLSWRSQPPSGGGATRRIALAIMLRYQRDCEIQRDGPGDRHEDRRGRPRRHIETPSMLPLAPAMPGLVPALTGSRPARVPAGPLPTGACSGRVSATRRAGRPRGQTLRDLPRAGAAGGGFRPAGHGTLAVVWDWCTHTAVSEPGREVACST